MYVTETLLAELTRQRNVTLLPGNDQFRRGQRVVVDTDPHQFSQMQTPTYGGWNDEMALVQSLSSSVVVRRLDGSCDVNYWPMR